jgi:hypothetical protein
VFRAHGDVLPLWVIRRHIGMGGDRLAPAMIGARDLLKRLSDGGMRSRVRVPGRPTTSRNTAFMTDGEPAHSTMRAERGTLDDLMAAAREDGISRFADVQLAVLEADGRISFFARARGQSGAPERPAAGS